MPSASNKERAAWTYKALLSFAGVLRIWPRHFSETHLLPFGCDHSSFIPFQERRMEVLHRAAPAFSLGSLCQDIWLVCSLSALFFLLHSVHSMKKEWNRMAGFSTRKWLQSYLCSPLQFFEHTWPCVTMKGFLLTIWNIHKQSCNGQNHSHLLRLRVKLPGVCAKKRNPPPPKHTILTMTLGTVL